MASFDKNKSRGEGAPVLTRFTPDQEVEGRMVVERFQDVSHNLDSNKVWRNHVVQSSKNEFKRTASIPHIVLEIWGQNNFGNKAAWYQLDADEQEAVTAKMLIDMPYLRTT
jgi:predicted CoA-binding protein